jgi:dTDP-4-amino-4,6-dideoxygalactose transaminase/thymidylate kinase
VKHKFIVLEGPDGAGKTTLAAMVADAMADRGMRHVSRRQTATGSPFAGRLMRHLADMLWDSGDATDLSDAFWVHSQAAWFIAHAEQVVAPALAEGHVIVDGWYYKLWSKLLMQGYSRGELDELFVRVPAPDEVILLDVDPAVVWRRKADIFRPTELGMHAGFAADTLGEKTFLEYQSEGLVNFRKFANEYGWTVLQVPGDHDETETAKELSTLVGGLLDVPSAATPLGYAWPHVDADLRRAVSVQLTRSLSDRDANGVIGEFEREFAAFVGSRHAVAFSSGTSALHAMCVAAGLEPGDEVIAPAYTFFATVSPFAYEGVRVIFADADRYGNMDPADLSRKLSARTRAVIVTHMWGNPADMTAIAEFCDRNGLMLMEDCSHAHFASWHGSRVGTYGAMAAFSTNQKAITTGEGGVLVTDDDRLRDLALLHGHYNKRCRAEIDRSRPYYPYALTGMGLKSRSTTLGAAIGLDQLAKAPRIERRRREILSAFTAALADQSVVSPLVVDSAEGTNGLYVLPLRFNATAATVGMAEFVDRLNQAGVDFDIPGSTGMIAAEPLFHRPKRSSDWSTVPEVDAGSFHGVEAFLASFFKGPLWGYAGDEAAVDHHLAVLTDLAHQVAR